MWPKQRDKIRIIMSHIERHTLLMRNGVRLEHIREEHEARLRALDHFQRTERSHRRQEYNAIREAISPRTYEEDLYRIRGRICEGTGKWLLRDAMFLKWLKETEKPAKLIWLQGIPGAGKFTTSRASFLRYLADMKYREDFSFQHCCR
jgi:CRISPR/Cas system-associated endonuclease/helicase Cas3